MEGLVVAQRIPREAAQDQSIRILEKIGLNEKLKAYPSEISGGQQQRVGIARALALNPKVILFDEPTSALDPELVGEVLQAIKRVAREGITMIVVTHEIDFALDIATKVVFMDGGLIVEQGMPDEVISHPKEERTRQFLRRLLPETSFSI
jgi:L-cystine transport system ATP-binding protein